MDHSAPKTKKRAGALKRVTRVRTYAAEYPLAVAGALAVLVVVHAVNTTWLPSLNPYKSLTLDPNTGTAVTIYLGAASAAAIVAGFAGVIIVFTIGSEARRVRFFRFEAGQPLQRYWLAAVIEPFTATLLGLVAALVQVTSGKAVAPWFFEAALVLLVHGAALLVWLLHELVGIVHADDSQIEHKEREVPAHTLFDP